MFMFIIFCVVKGYLYKEIGCVFFSDYIEICLEFIKMDIYRDGC